MKYFPIFLALDDQAVLVSGGGAAAIAKLRLLMKTQARLTVFAVQPASEIKAWADEGRLVLVSRVLQKDDLQKAVLVYAAHEEEAQNQRVNALAKADGILVNTVDDLQASTFITPAIVDRNPVTIAIGTEGAAPVLARAIKSDLEERLSPRLGILAKAGKVFRPFLKGLASSRKRREFWTDYYANAGPEALQAGGAEALPAALEVLLSRHERAEQGQGRVDLVGAGPGDPGLLTLKARTALEQADVVIHDQLVTPEILELARREATIIAAGKKGFGASTPQETINQMMISHAQTGAHVVRLKSGDPGVFGRLDEELQALDGAAINWHIIPGITTASAAVAGLGQSFTKRGRNSSIRLLTGHDIKGFAEHDWRALARDGEVAAIYMGKKSARFLQGRLLMHGADPHTPISVVENVSQPNERILATTLAHLPDATKGLKGPAIIMFGLAPRAAEFAPHKNISQERVL